MKISHKIILLFTALVSGIIILLAISVYYFSALERKLVFEKRLKSRANYSAQLYLLFGDSSNKVLNNLDSNSINGVLQNKTIVIFPYREQAMYPYDSAKQEPLVLDNRILEEASTKGELYFQSGERDAVARKYQGRYKSFIVVVAAWDKEGLEGLRKLLQFLIIGLFVAMMLSVIAGSLFSKKLLAPISQIIYDVNDISSNNLFHRIEAGNGKDELHQLANTFNELLKRLQNSFQTQRRFISNASHELSTPLTSISSQLEVALQKERTQTEYQNVLASIHEDVLQMRQLTKTLLEIAKADSQGDIELSEVRVDEVLLKIASELKKMNLGYRVEMQFKKLPENEHECLVFGNFELLCSAFKNIMENGSKYSTDKLSVVQLSYLKNKIKITISNKGNVIAREEIQKIFQPFYRGGNSKEYEGFGLGLPLAKAIIGLHKGSLEVDSDITRGTIFTILLPAHRSPYD